MSPSRLTTRIEGTLKGAAKVTSLIAFVASLTSSSLGEHFTSKCRTMPWLVRASPGSAASSFALHVSLRNTSSVKTGAILPTASVDSELDHFSIDGPISSGEEFVTAVVSSELLGGFKLKPVADSSTLPHLLAWLDGWRMDMERGLFRPLRSQASRLAVAYTDIFDTRGNPDKGGHGLGILLRYDFRKASERK